MLRSNLLLIAGLLVGFAVLVFLKKRTLRLERRLNPSRVKVQRYPVSPQSRVRHGNTSSTETKWKLEPDLSPSMENSDKNCFRCRCPDLEVWCIL